MSNSLPPMAYALIVLGVLLTLMAVTLASKNRFTIPRPSLNPDRFTKEIQRAIRVVVFGGVAVLGLGFCFVSIMKDDDFQSLVAGLIGSLVGSATAFAGAAWIWSVERRAVVQERTDDRAQQREDDAARADAECVRRFLFLLTELRALDYHIPTDQRFANERSKYLVHLQIEQNVALVRDRRLRGELTIAQNLIEDDPTISHFLRLGKWQRIQITLDWLQRLDLLSEGEDLVMVRPHNYAEIARKLEAVEEFYEEQAAENDHAAREDEERVCKDREGQGEELGDPDDKK